MKPFSLPLVLGFALCLGLSIAAAQTPLPSGEALLSGPPLSAFSLQTEPGAADAAEFSTVNAQGPGFTQAWRVTTKRDLAQTGAIELRALNARPVAVSDVAMVRFYARATEVSDETAAGRI